MRAAEDTTTLRLSLDSVTEPSLLVVAIFNHCVSTEGGGDGGVC